MVEKVIILGGGPAGLSAAIYTAREGFRPLVISGFNPGGQLLLTALVENIPGFPEGIMGPDIIAQMRKHAEKFGARFIDANATAVDLKAKQFKVTADDKVYETETLIIATGANAKWMGLESEQRFVGRGVSSCATCDGALYKDKSVIVVGGGDTAMEDAIFLTRFASSVTIVHRRDSFRASKIMADRVLKNPKIKVIWNSAVEEIRGDQKVRSVVIKNVASNKKSEMPIDGIFVAIGYTPNTQLFKGQLPLDDLGYLVTREEVETEIKGVYVAGDVADRFYRQAATASGSGVKAALRVREYLQNKESPKSS